MVEIILAVCVSARTNCISESPAAEMRLGKEPDALHAGVAVRCITPPLGTNMGGYGFRDHGAESVADDLMLKILAVAHGGRRGAIITADLVWLRREACDVIKAALAARYELDPDLVLLTCSHTHSGPQTAPDSPGIGEPDPEYMRWLLAEIVTATGKALADLTPVTLATSQGRGHLGVHRRVVVDGEAQMLPNPAGPRDDAVLVITATRAGGALKAVLFQYACHPTFLGSYAISADFPGAAMRRVEAELEAPCLFLQGCCGDVRPNVTRPDGRFRPATVEETHASGAELGDEVIRAVRAGGSPVTPLLAGRTVELGLLYAGVPTAADLVAALDHDQPARRLWARHLLSRPERLGPAAPFRIQRLDLGGQLVLVGLEGEICVGYGFAVKELARGRFAVPVGYANGCMAYIPTADMFPEGGYEVAGSYPYFGMAAPFEPAIDGHIRTALARLLHG